MSRPKSLRARQPTSQLAKSLTARPNRDQVSRVMGTRCSLTTAACGFSPNQADLRRKFLDGGLRIGEARAGLAVHDDRAQGRVARWPNDDPAGRHHDVPRECEVNVDAITGAPHGEAERPVPARQAVHTHTAVAL